MISIRICFIILTVWPFNVPNSVAQSFKGKQVLLYTRNGPGYVHDNIPAAIHLFDSLSKAMGFKLIKSTDPSIFSRTTLSKIDLIVFSSTNNDVFDLDDQRLAFRQYIEAGGKFLGFHSVVGTERKWTWFKQMLGGTFAWHPKFQPFDVVKMNPGHASLTPLPSRWNKTDECYFNKELYPGVQVLLAADLESINTDTLEQKKIDLNKGSFGRYYPISWEQQFDGGSIYINCLGHAITDYQQGYFVQYIKSSLIYMLKTKTNLDFKRAYAKTFNEPITSFRESIKK